MTYASRHGCPAPRISLYPAALETAYGVPANDAITGVWDMKVKVRWWAGTTQLEAWAESYEEAMDYASRNNNAYGPYFSDEDGKSLYDDGNGLRYEDADDYAM